MDVDSATAHSGEFIVRRKSTVGDGGTEQGSNRQRKSGADRDGQGQQKEGLPGADAFQWENARRPAASAQDRSQADGRQQEGLAHLAKNVLLQSWQHWRPAHKQY